MSRSRHNGHGRCGVCGDAGATRRKRETDAARVDDRELDAPWFTMLMEDSDREHIDYEYAEAIETGRVLP